MATTVNCEMDLCKHCKIGICSLSKINLIITVDGDPDCGDKDYDEKG